ncbi:zinc protease [Skermanella stibiiresistens SB22]|uniref:Zinc protease n=1 Tax=Skermanella stibiiresistens SB22 TaxID=1385369 RepID=W9GW32_9PROT|nr:pitrilysin family protein [Skermanella stibiiresistens]EWY36861.1 zinc protease [Skermanella stibiiresistens SB22]
MIEPLRRLIAAPVVASLLLISAGGTVLAQDPPKTADPNVTPNTASAPATPAAPLQAPETATPAAPRKGVFFPETFTLDNGMQVVVVTNQRVPVITHMVWYKVGAADEETGKSGIAHFLEHLMFKATDELKPGEFSRIVARNGGRDNAFTSWDYTAYFQNVAADRLELVMRMEADRMANLRLTDETVLPERDVVLEERRQRTENEPGDKLSELVQASLYVHHPYGTPIIGWENEIQKLTRDDANDFYHTWYTPNNAVLVIAGDVTVDQVRPLAEKYFGPIAPRPVPARVRVEEPPFGAERRVILRDAEVRQPSLRRLYGAPSYNRGKTAQAYPLQVLSEIVGGGATSRLYRSLVVEQRLATAAGTGYSPDAFDMSVFGAYVSPNPGVDMDKLEAALVEQLEKVVNEGVTAAEVETAKTRMEREAIFARDSLRGPAMSFGVALTTGRTIEDVEAWPERIAAVTVDQVNAAARAVLGQANPVTGLLLPAPVREAAAGQAGQPSPTPSAPPVSGTSGMIR